MKQPYSSTMGLFDWTDKWMEVYAKRKLRESTYLNYTHTINLAKKWMKNMPLDELLEVDVQDTLNILADLGYSKSTIHILKTVLGEAYEVAIRNGICVHNPTRYTVIPANAGEKEVCPLTVEQQKRLERECYEDMHGDLFLFLLNTGLRRAELCALKWRDFDRKRREIYIRESKTAAGIRHIPLLPICMAIISMQPRINEYIFNSQRTQKPITASVLRRTYQRLRKKAEISTLTNHVCRHTFATRLLEKGADPKAIAALLGHTNVAFTLNRYVQAQPEYLTRQIFLLEEQFGKNNGNPPLKACEQPEVQCL